MSDRLLRQLGSVTEGGVYPLYERYYRTEVRNALNDANPARVTTRLRDVLNDADAAVMTALSSEEDLSVGGFYLRDIPSVHLGQLFEMIRESFVTLGQPEFVVVHDERTPHVQGHRIELLQAIRSVIIDATPRTRKLCAVVSISTSSRPSRNRTRRQNKHQTPTA